MATKAQVVAKTPTVGVEFDSIGFNRAITPEVTIDADIDFDIETINATKLTVPDGAGIVIGDTDLGDYNSFDSAYATRQTNASNIFGKVGGKLGVDISSINTRIDNLANPVDSETDTYTEIGYDVNGNVISVTIYTDSTKTNLVQTKTLTYTSGSLTGIVVTDSNGITTLTQTLAYDSNDNLDSVEKDFA